MIELAHHEIVYIPPMMAAIPSMARDAMASFKKITANTGTSMGPMPRATG